MTDTLNPTPIIPPTPASTVYPTPVPPPVFTPLPVPPIPVTPVTPIPGAAPVATQKTAPSRKTGLKPFVKAGAKGATLLAVVGTSIWAAGTYLHRHKNKPGVTPYTSADEAFIEIRAKQFLNAKSDADRQGLETKMVDDLTKAGTNSAVRSFKATPEQAQNVGVRLRETYKVTIQDIDGKRFLYKVPLSPQNQGERNALKVEVSTNLHRVHDAVSHPSSVPAPRKPAKKPGAGSS